MGLKGKVRRLKSSPFVSFDGNLSDVDESESQTVPRLNMSHGFMREIIRNQVDRDEYDRLMNEKKMEFIRSGKPSRPKYVPNLYIPPHLRANDTQQRKDNCFTEMNGARNNIASLATTLADENSDLRQNIRRRLKDQIFKRNGDLETNSGGKDFSYNSYRITDPFLDRRPLFRLTLSDDFGDVYERIIYAHENSGRLAKLISRELGLGDSECRSLRNCIEGAQERCLS
ncbi:hypothetical protein AB6A40_000084 [Gnathostoma spinigerum]|uniref:Uncharacterized protein n=1 Tax=Gnathostoma spinigerum TaxID=75299 RepID=A0ABD6E2D1_9BILA